MPKLFNTAFALLLCLLGCAQGSGYFTNYGVNEGLPQSSIYDISQDKDGFLWVGTAGGLSRFDGYQFTTYKMSAHDPNAISSYKEFRFYNDSSGRLWIVHFNGISLYNSLTGDFTNVLVYNPRNVVIAKNNFFGEDAGFIWVGLCNYGIVKVDKKTLAVHKTPLTKTSLRSSNNVAYHGFLEKEKLWIVDNNESDKPVFYIYDILKQRSDTMPFAFVNITSMNDSEMLAIDTKSAFLVNKKTFTYQKTPVKPDNSFHSVLSMYRKSSTEAVLSSGLSGVFYINTQKLRVTRHLSVTDPTNKKSFLFARGVFEDRSGNTWIGTAGDGIWKSRYPFKNFHSYRLPGVKNNVFGLAVDNSNIYAGILAHGLTLFSKTSDDNRNITISSQVKQALNNAYSITPYGHDKMLLISNSGRINGHHVPLLYTKNNGKITLLNKEVQDLYARYWGRGNMRNFIFREPNGNYITNVGEYLVALDPCGENTFCPVIITHFPGENLASAFTAPDGTRWVGSFSGLFKQNPGGGWQRVHLPKNKEVKTINQDNDGNIWAGTNDEIFVLNKALKTIHHFQEEKELVNGHIYTIIKDNTGNMWFSHNKGLSVYHWNEKRFEHYDQSDGLQSAEFNIAASAKADDGELFFGGIDGVTAFYPHQIVPNPNAPAAKITGIKIFDEPLQSDTAYWNIRKIVLPYTENSISFEYALPEYTNQLKNRYQIYMKGVDDRWINTGDKRFARYAGLHPGDYVFQVRGANNDGVFGPQTTIEITIVPPFWQTLWFYVLIILAFIAVSVGVGVYIQKIRQRKAIRALELQHKIQLERERISRDLHDNVGTQLSLISKNIDGVIDPLLSVSEADRVNNLKNISQTSKEVIFTLRETIWALNREQISVEELSDKLKSFTQKLFSVNRDCQLSFTEHVENDNVVLSPSEAIHLFRICQEAIANSLKYARATLMTIDISTHAKKYLIIITDNGIGFDTTVKKTTAHYGLNNMQYRAEEIQCDFLIDSRPGSGTTITIQKK